MSSKVDIGLHRFDDLAVNRDSYLYLLNNCANATKPITQDFSLTETSTTAVWS